MKKVQVWLLRENTLGQVEVLLLKTVPERSGFWQPVTGHVDEGESFLEAAVREVAEETGLFISSTVFELLDERFQFESRWGGTATEEVLRCVLSPPLDQGTNQIQLDSREHVAFEWLDARQAFFRLVHPDVKKALEKALKFIK